ncbi:MAG TPA: MauE/DoxX family redox-associated membrane protein [Bryobacteraceae bacterium]|nr:MauE/DoxX family redox-associated membrane protein [Bryobacteraceae bacterium]
MTPTRELPAWKSVCGHIAAAAVAILFLTAGIWKMSQPFTWARMVEDLRVPYQFSLPLTMALAIGETLAGALVLIPRFRRWGAWLAVLLLAVFMIYIGVNYQTLIGKDCSCFPWVKRTVGPAFFEGDAAMLLAAMIAAFWSKPFSALRGPAITLAIVAGCAVAGFGFALHTQSGTKAPDTITVDGKPFSLQHGRVFLFFYDPQCGHCDAAARHMSKYSWKSDVTVIGIPTQQPQWAGSFLTDTGFKARTSLDLQLLKKTFPFGDPPYGVMLENGRERAPVPHYDEPEPADTLKKLGLIE